MQESDVVGTTVALEHTQRLAAYIPVSLARQILEEGTLVPGKSRMLQAAALFADISGFTKMSEELASDGPRGAEELNRVLLSTFTGMIEIIHRLGGAVNHFHGDAMAVYFPDDDGQAATRALVCGQQMQQLMSSGMGQVTTNRPPGKDPYFDLTMKIGLGYGWCQSSVVGDSNSVLEFVLAGPAVEEATAAEREASAGQVVAGKHLWERVKGPGSPDFVVVSETFVVPTFEPILQWSQFDQQAVQTLRRWLAAFVPPAVKDRLIGSGLASLAEHRPVTSVFVQFELAAADVTGHESAQTEREYNLQRYYLWANEVVTRFGGRSARLNRVLTGDKGNQLHIIFGAPVAPDAPDQAIRCALAMQAEAPIWVASQRIGLCAGKVFAGPVGANQRCEYTVVGDVVNLSARLTQVCQAGQVLIDANTAARVKDLIECVPLTPVRLKGKQELVVPYRVAGEMPRMEPVQVYLAAWDKPLVGRVQELARLRQAMDRALGGQGGVSLLNGPTGAGKTRLVAAGVRYWLDHGGVVYMGDCQPHTSDIPYGLWRNVWYGFFGLQSSLDVEARTAAVVGETQFLAPNHDADVALWGEVLGLPIAQPEVLSLLSAEARQKRYHNLARLCIQARSAQKPVLIVLEALHWADRASLSLIEDLALQLETYPVALLLTHRPAEDLALDVTKLAISAVISVEELPSEDARQLLSHYLGTSQLPATIEQYIGLRDRQGGDSPVNPLFLEESINVMMAMGILQIQKQGAEIRRLQVDETLLSQMQVPDTIHGLLLARLDRLPTNGRALLQIASIIGREFGLETLDMITPETPQRQILEALVELAETKMIHMVTGAPVWIYLFQHAMTHEVAYASLPYARRQVLHGEVARWLSERHRDNLRPYYPVLANHYSRAGIHKAGLRYSLAAARDAQDIFANAEAVQLYNLAEDHLKALGLKENWETAVDLFLARSEVYREQGDHEAAVKDGEQAQHLSVAHQDDARRVRATLLLADFRYRQSRYDEVRQLAAAVIDEADENTNRDDLARAFHWRGNAAAATRDFVTASESLDFAVNVFSATKNQKWLALALEGIAFVHYSQGELSRALGEMQRSVGLSRNFSTPANVASAMSNIGVIQFALGLAAEAWQTYSETIELARTTSQNILAFALSNRAESATYLGKFTEARSDLAAAQTLLTAMDDDFGLIGTYLIWGIEHSVALGEWSDATMRLELARELIDKRPDSYKEQRARLLLGLGQVELEDGEVTRAEALLTEARMIIEGNDLAWWRPAACYFLGRLDKMLSTSRKAKSRLLTGLEAVEKGGCPDYLPLLLLELAKLEPRRSRRRTYLQRCVEAAAKRARYIDKSLSFREAGEMLAQYRDTQSQKLAEYCNQQLENLA